MRELVAVVIGGVVGTGLRFALDVLVPHAGSQFPVSTLVVNLVGALVLGLLVARVWPTAPAWARAALGTGLLGSFTTFSAFAVSLVTLPLATAALYLVVTLAGGFGAAFAGLSLGRRSSVRRIDGEHE